MREIGRGESTDINIGGSYYGSRSVSRMCLVMFSLARLLMSRDDRADQARGVDRSIENPTFTIMKIWSSRTKMDLDSCIPILYSMENWSLT